MRLPVRPEQISREWLTAALRVRYPDVTVERVEVVDIISGTSTKIRVRLTYDITERSTILPSMLIVKGGFADHSPRMRELYFKEMRFYRDVQPFVPIHSPACYYAGTDPQSHQSIVILEDLRERGVRFFDPRVPQTAAQVARRLEAMACYHAATWNSPDFHPGGRFDWVGNPHEGFGAQYQQHYLQPEVWQHFIDSPRGAAVSQVLHDLQWMRGTLHYLAHCHRQWPPCLCHGDTHLGNLYEEADGTPGFFDAQVARAPWQHDVTYHLVGALDIVERRRVDRDLLQHYLASLARNGVEPPAFDVAWEVYRREIAYGYFIFIINETNFQTEAINTAYTARFGAAALDHDTVSITRREFA